MNSVSRHPLFFGTTFLVLAGATLYGCKDFLSDAAAPQGTLNEQSLMTRGGVEGTLIAAYRALDWNNGVGGAWGAAVSNWVWGSVASDDAYKGSEASDQPPIDDIEAYHWATDRADGYLNDKWRGVYEGVVRANNAIRLLRQVREAKPAEISDANARGIEGEALFLRAHFHFEGWRMWGNIPYYREDDTDFRKPNIQSAEVVAEILEDLEAAIPLLPATPRNGQIGRATSWTAKAYKGRVQVYAGQYQAALTTLRDIRQNGPYALEPSFDRVWTGFDAFDNGPETIFAFQASRNDGEPNGNNANYGERLNFPHSGSPFGCCGFHQPSQNLVNFFAVDANGLPLALTSPGAWNANNANFTAGSSQAVDPRLDWTVGRDGVPYKDWGTHASSWIRAAAYGGPYSPKKNAHEKASGAESTVGWVPTQLNSVNIHIFRYADLLLLLAEAEVEAGDLEQARLIVNQIRARAGQRAQGCGWRSDISKDKVEALYAQCLNDNRIAVPIDDQSITWANYEIGQYPATGWSQAFAREAVRFERRLELAMEGQRFFDLRRWGIAEDVINDYLHDGVGGGSPEKVRRPHLSGAERFVARHRWYPIPARQVTISQVGGEKRLQQNEGW